MKVHTHFLIIVLTLSVFLFSSCANQSANPSGSNSSESSTQYENLTGAELLESVSLTIPDQLKKTVEDTNINYGSTTGTSYSKGGNTRIESNTESGKQIGIYNASDNTIYKYIEGQTIGTKITGAISSSQSVTQNEVEGSSISNYANLVDTLPKDFIARVETLNGEKVIYIETTEKDSQNKTFITKMWLSMKHQGNLKTEKYSDGSLISKTVVTESTDDISDSLFIPPSNITFTE